MLFKPNQISMTQIEIDMARSTIRKNKAVMDSLERTDWEQRRYEIAKEIFPYCASTMRDILMNGHGIGDRDKGKTLPEEAAISAADFAEALITELKKGRKNESKE